MILTILFGVFIVLHGLVHLLYAGQSGRFFELVPDMVWPDGSWALSSLLGDQSVRWLGVAACVTAALGFVVGGGSLIFRQEWARLVVVGAAAFSSLAYLLLWNGQMHKLHDQGAVGILINVGLVAVLLVVGWPTF